MTDEKREGSEKSDSLPTSDTQKNHVEHGVSQLLEHGPWLYRYALSRVTNSATAEDLVQETLLAAYTQRREFDGRSGARTWLVGILRHKVLDHYRWKQRHPADQPQFHDAKNGIDKGEKQLFAATGAWRIDPNAGLEFLDTDPSKALERAQMRTTLQACIDRMPEALRRVYVLRELEGVSPENICQVAGITPSSLSVFLYRARQSIRTCMQKYWVDR